jgi:CDP-diacylglycerol--glycerol-3-phosphate 3-phosphatidyltransferase
VSEISAGVPVAPLAPGVPLTPGIAVGPGMPGMPGMPGGGRHSTFGPSALATPANAVTVARLAATPMLMGLIASMGASWTTVAVWFFVAATDGVDGYIARRMGTTRSGAFLDPLADKVCVLGAMVALVWRGVFWWAPVGIIAVREIGLIGYRSWLARRGVSMPATNGAKFKTWLQSLAVGAALLPATARHPDFGGGLLWAAVVLTLVTGAQYLRDGRSAERRAA